MDGRSLRGCLQQNSIWNFEENGIMDHLNVSANSSVQFSSEMRSINLNQMVSNLIEENKEYSSQEVFPMFVQHQTDQSMHYYQQMRNIASRSISESGYPRNIPDSSSTQYTSPKDLQVLIRHGDHTGINSLIRNVSLQQFRQMIGLQRSSGLTIRNDRKTRHQQHSTISSHETLNDANFTSSQEISCLRYSRRTSIANTLHIAIEKCYEQLNYIRDGYAETESKIGVQFLQKSPSIIDISNSPFSNLSNNPSRVDRLIAEYQYEYNRVIRLHERIQEDLNIQDIEATRQTLDEWFNAIHIVQSRRRQEIDNTTGKARLPDEKDVLQLAESLRILRIATRKIRTVLWYWLYWSTNSPSNKTPLLVRHQDENCFSSSINQHLFDTPESDIQGIISLKRKSALLNENDKENEYNE